MIRSVRCAVHGVAVLWTSQRNARIHRWATVVAVVAGAYVRFTGLEWCWIVVAVVAVWTAEALNTAVELLTDLVSPELHPLAGRAKDVAAGAVLIVALGSVLIGLLVMGPHVLAAWRSAAGR